jgi:hypothetical protein
MQTEKNLKLTALAYGVRKAMAKLKAKPDHKTLALWAADCAEHVLPLFEKRYPRDDRPRKAIEGCRAWAKTGLFRMKDVREASLAAHAAARNSEEEDAKAAARSAGQAMATPHVPAHALGAAIYAIKAAAVNSKDIENAIRKERNWQMRRLRDYLP